MAKKAETVRFELDLHDWISKYCQANQRSFSWTAEMLVRVGIESLDSRLMQNPLTANILKAIRKDEAIKLSVSGACVVDADISAWIDKNYICTEESGVFVTAAELYDDYLKTGKIITKKTFFYSFPESLKSVKIDKRVDGSKRVIYPGLIKKSE